MELRKLLTAAKLPQMRWHNLRHSHATLLGQMGVPIKAMSERLGHSNTSTTLNIYTHILPGVQKDISKRVGDLLRQARKAVTEEPVER